jgi:hypothetical protein
VAQHLVQSTGRRVTQRHRDTETQRHRDTETQRQYVMVGEGAVRALPPTPSDARVAAAPTVRYSG